MSELALGNLTVDPKTNRPRMTSMTSDIDTEALTQSLYEAKKLPALRIEEKIEVNDAKVKAYEELGGKLREMQSALDGLRNPPGSAGADDNLFERKAAYFSSDTTTQPGTLLGVQTTNRADLGSFDLVVDDLATAHKVMSGAFASADETVGPGAAGTLTIGLGSGPTADVAVGADMTAYDLRDAINVEAETTGVDASVLKVADDDYRLVLAGRATGADNGIQLSGGGSLSGELRTETLSTPSDAHLQVDGVTVSRADNTINDVMGGLTLDLYQADPGTTVTVDVESDFTQAKEALQGFVDAYNGLRDFIDGQRAVNDEGEVDRLTSPLFGDALMRTLGQNLASDLGDAVDGLAADAPSTLAAIGVEMGEGGRLSLDHAELDSALLDDPRAVRDVFEFRAETGDPSLAVYAHPPRLPATDFTVTKSAGAWQLDDGTTRLTLEQDGNALTAPEGSAYEGLTLFWTGSDDPSGPIDVSATQGVADRLYGTIARATDATDGTVQQAIRESDSQIERWREDIERIETRAEDHRLMLVDKFARLERALSLSESMLNQVRAQTDAMTADP